MPKKIGKKIKAKAKKPAARKPLKARKADPKAKKGVVARAVKKASRKPAKKVAKKVTKKAVAKKNMSKKITRKVTPKQVAKKPAAQKAVKPAVKAPAPKPQQAAKVETLKPQSVQKAIYKVGHYVVYPTHGVGRIMAEETQMIGDIELRMLVISFEKDKMTLRVPVHRATAAGLRPVSSSDQMKKVFVTLKSRARTSRGMWSRRAQEYEAKINSGNIFYIAEVVRDLHQNVDQSERSYSERMIYESALARLVGEFAAAESIDHKTATDKLMKLLRAKVAAAAAEKEAVKEAA